jgi:serine/threonine-protein kinase
MFSPDGAWIAYVSDESGEPQVYLRQFPNGRQLQVSRKGGSAPAWRADGEELFYRNANEMMAVAITRDPELTLSETRVLFEADHYRANNYGPYYDVSPDGERFLMVGRNREIGRELVVVHNWFEELQRLAPPPLE